MIELEGYHKRFDPDDNYEKILFRAGRGLQSAEMNDLQEQLANQVQKVSNTILEDGDVVKGGALAIEKDTGVTQIGESSIYIRGSIRELPAGEITIPTDDVLYIGVWLTEAVITEIEDPGLRDPAVQARNYREPGAARLQISCEWGLKTDEHTGTFYPVYRIENAVHVITEPPPQLDAITVALARYDRESNGGSYVVEGMEAIGCGYRDDLEEISITEGKAHIEGFAVQFPTALRKTFPVDPDLRTVINETHTFQPGDDGNMRLNTNFSPIKNIQRVSITAQKTEDVTKETVDPNLDPLLEDSVLEIVSVVQGDTTYVQGTDYLRTGTQVDWSPGGAQPASGSTYSVTYKYMAVVEAQDPDTKGFTVGGAVTGSLVLVDYQWKMPRIDMITLDSEGVVRRLKGIAHPFQPNEPRKPDDQLQLAVVYQTWDESEELRITNNAVRVVSMSDLKAMKEQIGELYDLVAIERLRSNANASDPAAKKGVFVDPFLDDDMRDQGEEQTAAIVDGELVLPVIVDITDLEGETVETVNTLEYELETLINQPMYTGEMAVNPYQAFDAIPPKATLTPQVDRWTTYEDQWNSPITRRFTRWTWKIWEWGRSTSRWTQELSRSNRAAEFLRVRSVRFKIVNFWPGERVTQILFDGIKLLEEEAS